MLRSPAKSGGIKKLIGKGWVERLGQHPTFCWWPWRWDWPIYVIQPECQPAKQRCRRIPKLESLCRGGQGWRGGRTPKMGWGLSRKHWRDQIKGSESFWMLEKENGYEPWAPFKDIEEWELVQWIMQSGLSQGATDKYLKLPIVSCIMI